MTLSEDDLERIVSAVETIEESLSVLVAKQSLSRETYRSDREQRDVGQRPHPTSLGLATSFVEGGACQ
jgi:hypothetical protein